MLSWVRWYGESSELPSLAAAIASGSLEELNAGRSGALPPRPPRLQHYRKPIGKGAWEIVYRPPAPGRNTEQNLGGKVWSWETVDSSADKYGILLRTWDDGIKKDLKKLVMMKESLETTSFLSVARDSRNIQRAQLRPSHLPVLMHLLVLLPLWQAVLHPSGLCPGIFLREAFLGHYLK